jgi:hypothetical protein
VTDEDDVAQGVEPQDVRDVEDVRLESDRR